MPVTPTYPGVYIEEVPSGVRTIVGVATSITAFIGRAVRGPVNEPLPITSFADFERQFGGLGVKLPMGYAVRDFYLNGGTQAIIVRLYKNPKPGDPPADPPPDGKARFPVKGLELVAADPGAWGAKLRVALEPVAREPNTPAPAHPVFHVTIREARPGGAREKLLNVTTAGSDRRIDRVLAAESNLMRWDGEWAALSAEAETDLQKALEAVTAKATALQDELFKEKPDPGEIAKKRDEYHQAQRDLGDAASKADGELADALAKTPHDLADNAKAEQAVVDAEKATKGDDGDDDLGPGDYTGSADLKTGIHALDKADLFNLLCIPPTTRAGDTAVAVYQTALAYCQKRRAMLLVDSKKAWGDKTTAANDARNGLPELNLTGPAARNAALYFPRVQQADPLRDGQVDLFVPCGIIAGVMARTDATRGVWKAPAGLDAALNGIQGLQVNLTDDENGLLNPLGINCLRSFPVSGRVVWGARTLRGADQSADEYKYVPVRRLALYIEESLYRGTQWVVFEPNDEPLWAQIRLNVGAFMNNLFRKGAFQGKTASEAYFVKCDKETTTQNDIDLGIVNIHVGFAPLKPAEFVIITLQQMAGQIEV